MLAKQTSIDKQNRAIEQWAVAWSAHDVDRLLPLFTADAVYEDVPMGVVSRGAAELQAFAESVFARLPDVSFELQSAFVDGAMGGAEWAMRGTREGKRVEIRGMSAFEFAGDRIRRCSDYWDMANYLRQLGVT
jgi:steroid delta-isomerase-like uncharacterized protein